MVKGNFNLAAIFKLKFYKRYIANMLGVACNSRFTACKVVIKRETDYLLQLTAPQAV